MSAGGVDADAASDELWLREPARGDFEVYAVVDSARDPRIQRTLFREVSQCCCLERAPLKPEVREAAPYLARLREGGDVARQLIETGFGDSWGIFAVAPAGLALEAIRRHLHGQLRVKDEEGRNLFFRYYDPRVLRVFLPTCSREQLLEFFGPLRELWAEDEDGRHFLRFQFDGEKLAIQRTDVSAD